MVEGGGRVRSVWRCILECCDVWIFFIGEVNVGASVWYSVARLGVVELNVVCCSCWCEGLLR